MSDDSSIDSTVESSPSPVSTVRGTLEEFYRTASYQVLNSQSTGSLDGVFHTRREVREGPSAQPNVLGLSQMQMQSQSQSQPSANEFHTKAPDMDHTESVTNTLSAYLREIDSRTQEIIHVQMDPRALLYKTILSMHDRLYTFLVNPNILPHQANRIQEVLKKYNVTSLQVPRAQVLKDLVIEPSMEDTIRSVSEQIARPTEEPELLGLVRKYQGLMDMYKTYGDELLQTDAVLNETTKRLEALHERSNFILGLHENNALEPLYKSYMSYIETEAETLQLEDKYLAVVAAYKRWNLTRTLLKSIRSSVVVTEAAADSEHSAPMCPICITNEVNYVSVQCGHTMCSTCIGRMTHVCYICRTPIKQKLRLYF